MRNKRLFKQFALSTLLLSTLFSTPIIQSIPIEAQETISTINGVVDFQQGDASIVIVPNENQSLIFKQFQVYKLFDAKESNGSINYTYNSDYLQAFQNVIADKLNKEASEISEYEIIDYIQELEGTSLRLFVEELRDELVSLSCQGDIVNVNNTREDGCVVLDGLKTGYYLIDEVTDVQGSHSASSLILLDTAQDQIEIHIKSDYPDVIKKIWEDDGDIGWNDIGDYEIGQNIPYQFQTQIPDIASYDTYSMIFHDIMDSSLSFDDSSVSITIKDQTKTYTLTQDEFDVDSNVDGETFQVNIEDIKAIVDREFNSTYGQIVTLSYQASLNDQASIKCGRAGFENRVRLEFSNNPDHDGNPSTGYTPWDTVVCFTYQINGLKVDNENTTLEGAKFRLYLDEECTQEVMVKESESGYIVMNSNHCDVQQAVEMISNDEGVFNILGLDQGTYYLKETQAPDGYRQLKDAVKITITPEFCENRNEYQQGQGASENVLMRLSANGFIRQFISGAYDEMDEPLQTNVENGSVQLSIVNQKGTKLPVTGSNITLLLVASGSALMLVSFLKKKHEN
ncbi:SpaA isopeptide-forming pilin-related protein [Floccifex sp.]|uniref:SpaA isopeptide-forming pilin-related protein n=1 Tax=Floccifex sp. TaxID=2815810 RepID=UPI003F0F37AA